MGIDWDLYEQNLHWLFLSWLFAQFCPEALPWGSPGQRMIGRESEKAVGARWKLLWRNRGPEVDTSLWLMVQSPCLLRSRIIEARHSFVV